MSKTKIPKKHLSYRLSEDVIEIIEHESEKMHISKAAFIDEAIRYYDKKGAFHNIEEMLEKTYKSVQFADISCQEIQEMLNMMCFDLNCNTALQLNVRTSIYNQAKKNISEKIRKFKNAKSQNIY